ncbi:MAG: hypothetical protein PWR30_274 [Candidatus Woesearchaeota archaeon]|nr:hypothetical protein [Candidatus Woesearchaeota archaeon]
MDLEKAIEERCSVRHYKDKEVEKEKLVKVLNAGRLSPSSGNIQNWVFIVIDDDEKKKTICDACNNQDWMLDAPIFIVILGDEKKAVEYYGERGEKLYTIENCSMAAQNMMLEAVSLGLGSCFVASFIDEKIREITDAPSHMRPIGIITLGYPKDNIDKDEKKDRDSLYSKVYFNKYGDKIKDFDLFIKNYNVLGRSLNGAKKFGNKIKKRFGKKKNPLEKKEQKKE